MGQHERIIIAGGELGELQALLEVEQVEPQLLGRVASGQAVHHIKQQGRLARSGLSPDQRVDRVVVEPQRHRAVRAERHRNGQTAGGIEAPQRLGQQSACVQRPYSLVGRGSGHGLGHRGHQAGGRRLIQVAWKRARQ